MLIAGKSFAQTNPDSTLSREDSLELINQLSKLLNSGYEPVSYVFLNVGIGNRLFSIKNNALNAFQTTNNRIIYSPSLAYFHKSGFGLTTGANLLTDEKGFGVNQFSLSPSYDLTNKDISFGISYAHYFVKNKYSSFSSPIQNDFYTALSYKKTWIQPGVALGYSTGEYKEVRHKDTVIAGIKRHFYDSINYQLNVFSVMLSASHQFSWYGVMSKSDGIIFRPTLMLNAGSGKTTISHNTNAVLLFNFLEKRGRIAKSQQSKFELQSIGLNLDLDYTIGPVSFEPQFYIDYYLQAADPGSKKITPIFTFNVGYSF